MAKDETRLLEMGARIKELREANGYRQQWIADEVGVSLRAYQLWQEGKVAPEQENLEKLAELFHVAPRFITRGDTPNPFGGDQLDRIEEKLDRLLAAIETVEIQDDDEIQNTLEQELSEAVEQDEEQASSDDEGEQDRPGQAGP
jgi:transcriptional regulator with XRE-family HTH domain